MDNNQNISEENIDDSIIDAGDGTELETNDDSVAIMEKPFDPTKIKIDTSTPSLDTLIERIEFNEIELKTESYFQRNPDLWDNTKKSRLIESLLIQFPLPAFYFDGSNKDKWLVVDGLQRLSSIRDFVIDDNLKLTNMEFLTQLNGKRYSELGRSLQRIIKSAQVVVYVIQPGTPTDVKYNIFKRINTGGLVLTPQEIRHALFQGRASKFIAELAGTQSFLRATSNKINPKRMMDRDFANRFLCFYLLGFENFQPDLDTYMSKAMARVNDLAEAELEVIQSDFNKAMDLAYEIFGEEAFRKIYRQDHLRLPPINKALYDALSTQFALLTSTEAQILQSNGENFKIRLKDLLATDENFFSAVSSSTGDKGRVMYRHSKVKELIQRIIAETE
jgi:uncharacterized protein with ParB-like and HNH nuclease domain